MTKVQPQRTPNNVQAQHSRTATIEARRAHHWHTFFDVDRNAAAQIAHHAARAGQYACYSGIALCIWRVVLDREFSVTAIRDAFEAAYHLHADLLATPASELAD